MCCASLVTPATPRRPSMRMSPLLLVASLVAALAAATAQPAAAAENATWSPPLTAGSGAGVAVRGGAAQLEQRSGFRAPLQGGRAEGRPDTAVPAVQAARGLPCPPSSPRAPPPPSTSVAFAPTATGRSGSPPTTAPPC